MIFRKVFRMILRILWLHMKISQRGLAFPGIGGAFALGERADHDVDAPSNKLGWGVYSRKWQDIIDKFFHHLIADIVVGIFTSPKSECDFDLHVMAKEVDGMIQFHLKIVGINAGAQLHFLYFINMLVLFAFLILFGLLVTVTTIVDQATDGWVCVGSNLHQIHAAQSGCFQCLLYRQYAKLSPVRIDNSDLACPNTIVDSDKILRGPLPVEVIRATQDALKGWMLNMLIKSDFIRFNEDHFNLLSE